MRELWWKEKGMENEKGIKVRLHQNNPLKYYKEKIFWLNLSLMNFPDSLPLLKSKVFLYLQSQTNPLSFGYDLTIPLLIFDILGDGYLAWMFLCQFSQSQFSPLQEISTFIKLSCVHCKYAINAQNVRQLCKLMVKYFKI